jgi:enoyl reductase-like protein
MTYAEVAQRMVRLMYVAHEKRWVDPSLKKLTGDWLRRVRLTFPYLYLYVFATMLIVLLMDVTD